MICVAPNQGLLALLILLVSQRCCPSGVHKAYTFSPSMQHLSINASPESQLAVRSSSVLDKGPTWEDTWMAIHVNETSVVTIQYWQSYFPGYISYHTATEHETNYLISSSYFQNDFKQFNVTQGNLTLHWRTANPYDRYVAHNFIATISVPNDAGCPLNGSTLVVAEKPIFIFSDYPNGAVVKTCVWLVAPPPTGKVNVITVHDFYFSASEILYINGTFDGLDASVVIEEDSSLYSPEDTIYFDSGVTLMFKRSGETSSHYPSFRLLVNVMERNFEFDCSLDYSEKVFRDPFGTFTNMVPFTTYEKNQKCMWDVELPADTCLEIRSDINIGGSSGDWITIQYTNGMSNLDRYPPVKNIIEPYIFPRNITFFFVTDALYEYNGFLIKYRFLKDDCKTPVEIPSTTAATSTASAKSTEDSSAAIGLPRILLSYIAIIWAVLINLYSCN